MTAPAGRELIEEVISLTELPEPLISQELEALIQDSGKNPETLTIDELRASMLAYLEMINSSMSKQ